VAGLKLKVEWVREQLFVLAYQKV